jgi:hypothetical protein
VAKKFRVVPAGVPKLPGDMLIDCSTAVVTVRVAVALVEPVTAVMVTEPGATPLATPPLLIVAKAVFDELQLTVVVKFWLLPSL